ncbi:MAG: hypothetical protein WAQ29_07515 [Nitrososphaeraceae archaeon]
MQYNTTMDSVVVEFDPSLISKDEIKNRLERSDTCAGQEHQDR